MIELRQLFVEMMKKEASDLHLVVGAPPQIRVHGQLESVDGFEPLMPEQTRELVFGIMTNEQRQKYEVNWELDFSYSIPNLARWRVNAFTQRGAVGAAFRIIPNEIRALGDLAVPDVLYKLCDLPRGLVLVTGPTGSGKSTTLAGMIDVINQRRFEHILTVEDPIEFVHNHKNCIVNQREVGGDTEGFARALKSALRQDPDVILVGEMRDLETIQTALTAAETGHLVFGTLHTNGAAKTVDRVIDVFPPHQQSQVRVQLASSLQGVVTQTLIPRRDGGGRIAACEVMIPNAAIRNLIREGKIFQIQSVMQTSQDAGMQTLDAALATLVRTNMITRDEAIKRAAEEAEFDRLLASGAGAPTPGKLTFTPPESIRLTRRFDRRPPEAAPAPARTMAPQPVAGQPAPQPPTAPAAPPPMEFRPVAGQPQQPGPPLHATQGMPVQPGPAQSAIGQPPQPAPAPAMPAATPLGAPMGMPPAPPFPQAQPPGAPAYEPPTGPPA